MKSFLTRKEFLHLTLTAAAGAVLSGCGKAPEPTPVSRLTRARAAPTQSASPQVIRFFPQDPSRAAQATRGASLAWKWSVRAKSFWAVTVERSGAVE